MSEFDYYQNILTLTILILGYFIAFLIGCREKSDVRVVTYIYLWHSLFAIFYYYFTVYNGADALSYFRRSLTNELEFYPGSKFIIIFTSYFSQRIDANYLNATLIYNVFGVLGLLFLYLAIKFYVRKLNKYWFFILFVPSMSFWSAGLGKDAISFFATCLFLYAIVENKKPAILIPIAFFFMFMVRPHIAFMMLVSYVIYFIIQARVHLLFKLLTLPAIFAGIFISLGFVQQYVG